MKHLIIISFALILSLTSYGQGPILGNTTVCEGLTTSLSDATTGGTWSSSSIGIATVGSTGIVTGVSAGIAIITYTVGAGTATTNVTVNLQPGTISGAMTVCNGSIMALTDPSGGGTWSSSNVTVTVGSSSGVVIGISAGTAVITYAFPTGCESVAVITINPTPTPITGSMHTCPGLTTNLTDAIAGGTWNSSNPAVATIGASTGIVTATSVGTAMITYTLVSGCMTSAMITVNPLPIGITGSPGVCSGFVTSLTDATGGGTWSSSNTAVASIGSGGFVTGMSPGTAIITYTIPTGCIATVVTTVNPSPGPINGLMSFCYGATTTLSDATGGGAWSSGSTGIATISGSGVVTGILPGAAIISYTLPTGCGSVTTVTINPVPGPINGITNVCQGATTALSDAVAGGTWSSSNIAVGTINISTGTTTGISPGTATISYTLATGCYSITVTTVNALPGPINGSTIFCNGTTTTLSDAISGGAWSSSSPSIATISSTGIVTGVSAGTVTISYILYAGCNSTTIVTVSLSPGPITGSTSICAGTSTTLSDAVTGGVWSSSNAAIATIGPATGTVTGSGIGVATITYIVSSGCIGSVAVTVNPVPASISGAGAVCTGATTALSDATTGGVWASSNPAIAMVSAGGVVTGITAGSSTISYTLSGGCATSIIETVNPLPSGISGATTLCIGTTSLLSDTSPGGVWSSVIPSIASIDATGDITGISPGTDTISYSLSTGCYAAFIVTVSATTSPITGTTNVCVSGATTLSDAVTGGTWASSNVTIAVAGPASGIVTGVSAGTTIITYSLGSGCTAMAIITVNPMPAPITGGTFACIGSTLTLDDSSPGGIWNSSNTSIADIAFVGGSSGVVTGMSAGMVVMTYSLGTGCYSVIVLTVNAAPTISATATLADCGGLYLATASGGATYSWAPSTGVNCTTCATTYINPNAAAYVVTGTLDGCTNTAIITVNNNRIYGHITLGATVLASLSMKAWLIQYNAADSSIITTDSMLTCVDGTLPYYEFDDKPEGNYFVKAELLGSVPGTTGYVPTYGLMNAHWDSATTVIHTGASDSLHINMIYGFVPAGTGSISGHIVSGAGRGTSGEVPVVGMLVYLLDNTYSVITYTYTDGSGAYSFSGLAHGTPSTYIVYPENYNYYTTPSGVITLSFSSDVATNVDFKQHTTLGTITPFDLAGVAPLAITSGFTIYPNPATVDLNIKWTNQPLCNADVEITDMLGREVYRTVININATTGQALLDVNGWGKGIYMITVRSAGINFSGKLMIGE